MAQKVVLKAKQPRARSRLLGRLLVVLVIVGGVWLGWHRMQRPSEWLRFQEGLPFSLIVPDPIPPGFSLDGDPVYEPAGRRQQVKRVTINFTSGLDGGRLTFVEEALATGPPLPKSDAWGREASQEQIGPYRVILLPQGEGTVAHLIYGLTRITITATKLDRKQMRQVVSVLVPAR